MRAIAMAMSVAAWLGCGFVSAENWPGWRGPRSDGTSLEMGFPLHWSATSNVVWKVALPGAGHASPVIWEDSIFTVSAVPTTEERVLICVDRQSGRELWQRRVMAAPLERKHSLNSHASSTPATDGQQVYVSFLDVDRMLVAAYSMEGDLRWLVRPGRFSSMHGFCSSPVLYRDLVIVNGDHDGDGYIVALDRKDGSERWRINRPNQTRSYCVPAIFNAAGKEQMVLSGTKCITSYEPDTGNLIWIIDGPTEQYVASLVYHREADLFFMTGGFPDHHLMAIRADGKGNVTDTHVAWHHERAQYVSYVPSPIVAGDYFLVISDTGDACCFEARSGDLQWRERFGSHHASLVSAEGLVYFLSDQGLTRIVRPGPSFQLVAKNDLEEKCFASPALSDGQIFIRGFEHLYCIGAVSTPDPAPARSVPEDR